MKFKQSDAQNQRIERITTSHLVVGIDMAKETHVAQATKASGKKSDRPELARCLEYLRSGDTLVIWKFDRLGRTTKQLIELSHDLKERRVSLQIITLGVDTSTPAGKLFFAIMAGLAEMEAETIRERTQAGLQAARARGRKGGRPPLDKSKVEMALLLYESWRYTTKEITEQTGVSKAKLYQVLRNKKA